MTSDQFVFQRQIIGQKIANKKNLKEGTIIDFSWSKYDYLLEGYPPDQYMVDCGFYYENWNIEDCDGEL